MELTGKNLIGGVWSAEGTKTFHAVNPTTGQTLPQDFFESTKDEVNQAASAAMSAFWSYRKISSAKRADFLETIAGEILNLGDAMIDACVSETGLPAARVVSERARTVYQFQLFAELLREGFWVDARLDSPDFSRTPIPKPDLRSMLEALGPVAVFGASNFPLAYSVGGGDSASALAAGCPVVVKAHPAHPATSEFIAKAVATAMSSCEIPAGTFSMLQSSSNEIGSALVGHPDIKAVGFTGSFAGGKALFEIAAQRPEPIPVYAEMGSTNPVFILPGALAARGGEIAKGLAASTVLGVGQFCTNPGLHVGIEGSDFLKFSGLLAEEIEKAPAGVMLTSGIAKSFQSGIRSFENVEGVVSLAKGGEVGNGFEARATYLRTSGETFRREGLLEGEVFGPSTIGIAAQSKAEMLEIASGLHGHLTASIFAETGELTDFLELIEILRTKVGRIIFNGFPTGVEVGHAIVHGGPFPSSTDGRTSSVGTRAIGRFCRPVCYQNFPEDLLPLELQSPNPLGIWRLRDGKISKN